MIVTILLLLAFAAISYNGYQNYNDRLEDHPFVTGEFIVAILVLGITIWQLVVGYQRKKVGFEVTDEFVEKSISDDSVSAEDEVI